MEPLDRPQYRAPKWGWYDGKTIYILRGKLAELAGGTDTSQAIARELYKRGLMERGDKEKLHFRHMPLRGKVEHYRLSRAEFLGDVEDDATEE
jgi:hypothetical protein